jgi:hypothetical protein
MNYKLLAGMCMLFLLIVAPSHAISTSYETASVSRLVGNSPEDLINQLDTEELNLNHASYYGDYYINTLIKLGAIKSLFDEYIAKGIYTEEGMPNYPAWYYNQIENDFSSYKANELLVIEAEGNNNPLRSSHDPGLFVPEVSITPTSVERWKNPFSQIYPLFVFDSDYSGLAIPKRESFINQLTRYSQIVAPTFLPSSDFVKSIICNLGDGKTLGNSFREARNKYYTTVNPNKDEMIGITLMSYHLYGNPLAITTTPKYNEAELKKYCGNLLGKKEETPFTGQEFEVQMNNDNIQETINLQYNVNNIDGYEVLNVTDAQNILQNYNLVEPVIVRQHDLPLNAIITNISFSFTNSETLNLNLPEYNNGLVDRICYADNKNESFETVLTYKEDKQTINVFIYPLSMQNCEDSTFELYKTISYTIDYISPSPIYFDNIEYPRKILPNTDFNITIDFAYVKNAVLNGEIELYENDKLIYQKELDSQIPLLMVYLTSSEKEGIAKYKIRYLEGNEILTESEFDIEKRILNYKLDVPDIVKGSADIKLEVRNYEHFPVNITVGDNLLLDGIKKQGSRNEYVLQPGLNEFAYNYVNLLQSNQKYQLIFDLGYNNKKEVINGVIVTNHKPVLNPIPDIIVKEGELVELNVSAVDIDGDSISYGVSAPVGNDNVWQTQIGDSGSYAVTITATDGYATDELNINVMVLPYNTPPNLLDIDDITVYEGNLASFSIYATDPDGDNLTYLVNDTRFNQTYTGFFEWKTSIGDAGTYFIKYSTSDGKETITKEFRLEVVPHNCTTEPIIYSINGQPLEDGIVINIKEGEVKTVNIISNIGLLENGHFETDNPIARVEGDQLILNASDIVLSCGDNKGPLFSITSLNYPSSSNQNRDDAYGIQGEYSCTVPNTEWCYGYDDSYSDCKAEVEVASTWLKGTSKSCTINGQYSTCYIGDVTVYLGDGTGDRFYLVRKFNGWNDAWSTVDCDNDHEYCSIRDHSRAKEVDEGRTIVLNSPPSIVTNYAFVAKDKDICTDAWTSVWYAAGYSDPFNNIYSVNCVDNSDCGAGQVCDNRGKWDTWKCVDDACNPNPCPNYCSGDIKYFSRECSWGSCSYSTFNCNNNDHYLTYQYYCNGDERRKHRIFNDYTCSGTNCVLASSNYADDQLVEVCDFGCSNGECLSDPCLGINTSDYCDGDILKTNGICKGGIVTYDETICNFDCANATCLANPCEGVICDSYCNGFDYYSNGQCFEGNCQYNLSENSIECGYNPNHIYITITLRNGDKEFSKQIKIIVEEDKSCASNNDCGQGEYCKKPDCSSEAGECTAKPEFCMTLYDPVCGCDDNTYPNSCALAAAGINKKKDGECIACFADNDCKPLLTTHEAPMPVCINGSVYIPGTKHTCVGPGTVNSYCEHEPYIWLVENCSYGCDNGECNPDPCLDVSCDSYCDSYTYYYDGYCSAGNCIYLNEPESFSCNWSEPVCYNNSDCGKDGFIGMPYCKDSFVARDYRAYECLNPGVPYASCSNTDDFRIIEDCEFGCEDSECLPDPCLDVMCDNYCNGTKYYSGGRCVSGECRYSNAEINSRYCTNGYCRDNNNCGYEEYCKKAACSSSEGTCTAKPEFCMTLYDPVCGCDDNTYSNECALAAAGVNKKKDGECKADLCKGIICSDYCDGYTYYSDGVCAAGTCEYIKTEEKSFECGWYDPECYSDSDCGQNTWLGQEYCKEGNVWDAYTEHYCENPGNPSAECLTLEEEKLKKMCSEECFNGECIGIECYSASDCGVSSWVSEPYCEGNELYQNYKNYICLNPGTTFSKCLATNFKRLKESCEVCDNGNCISVACNNDDDCGIDGFIGEPYYKGNTQYQKYRTYICLNPGTALSKCLYGDINQRK